MALVSDAMYDVQTAVTSYVSSSAYYGYVPHWTRENQQRDCTVGRNDDGHSITGDQCDSRLVTAMETDDDGYDRCAASTRLNNRCVIVETSPRRNRRLGVIDSQQRYRQRRQHEQRAADTDTPFRRNMKRRCSDHEPVRELKKFREGGGNGRVYHGTGSTKDYGLAQMYYESASLRLDTTNHEFLQQPTVESCPWAAGNSSLISNPGLKHLSSNNGSKWNKSNTEYERMLFETHGCSAYHYQRMQFLDNDHIETEF